MKTRAFASAVVLMLSAGAALATSPEHRPIRALSALDSPALAPAMRLMNEVTPRTAAHRAPVVIAEPDLPTRSWLSILSFGWYDAPAPRVLSRCETVYTPYHGTIETCAAPLHRPMPRVMPERIRTLRHSPDMDR